MTPEAQQVVNEVLQEISAVTGWGSEGTHAQMMNWVRTCAESQCSRDEEVRALQKELDELRGKYRKMGADYCELAVGYIEVLGQMVKAE